MRSFAKIFLLAALAFASPALAQVKKVSPAGTSIPTTSVCFGQPGGTATCVDADHPLPVTSAGGGGGSIPTGTAGSPNAAVVTVQGVSGGTPQPVTSTGNVASAAADSGNPIKIGYLGGSNRYDWQGDTNGNGYISLRAGTTALGAYTTNADGLGVQSANIGLASNAFGRVFNGTSWDRQRGDTTGTWTVGNVASGATDSGNPIKLGCIYNSSQVTFTNGQRTDCQSSVNGSIFFSIGTASISARLGSFSADSVAASNYGLDTNARLMVFNGTTEDRARGNTSGLFTIQAPVTSADTANVLTPVTPSSAIASNKIVCAAACNVYDARINATSSAVWVMAFNATTLPSDGAVTPAEWWQVATNTTLTVNFANANIPTRYTTGLVLACSTTGPFTLTASSTCTFTARAK